LEQRKLRQIAVVSRALARQDGIDYADGIIDKCRNG
jgi:hypothetical protein